MSGFTVLPSPQNSGLRILCYCQGRRLNPVAAGLPGKGIMLHLALSSAAALSRLFVTASVRSEAAMKSQGTTGDSGYTH